ncbi:MAG: gamma-glutamyltransferase family protein [Geminicoccaceae bacterium]|nr:MAG: gamma-glutamyltransferase family protein [Geminicoccaceae bacterium]
MQQGGFTTRPEIRGTFGAAASTHWLASQTAMGVLERGGNAFDAVVAGGFVLQVVEPHLNGPGGEVPILLHEASDDRCRVLCGQGPAPAAATIQRLCDFGLDQMPGTGLLPACVPGSFGAWLTLLRDYGTWPLADVLAPALDYAARGYPLQPQIVNAMQAVAELFERHWPSSAAIYPTRTFPQAGDLFTNPELAATWRRLLDVAEAANGSREVKIEAAMAAWYEGFVAEAIDRFYRSAELLDCTGQVHPGLLTGSDLAGWRPAYEDPLTFDYHGLTVAKCGPWSQGPLLLQTLALLEGIDLADLADPRSLHSVIEALKLAFADREAWYGDPDHVDVPLAGLLDRGYAAERRALIGETASMDFCPGSPGGRTPKLPRYRIAEPGNASIATLLGVGEPTTRADGVRRGDTCHIDVVDRWGNMVAATPSGGWFQSSPVVPGLGFSLTVRGQMFWLEEGLAASLAPKKRPRTTLTPSMALRDGKPYLAWGTPGGDQQDQWSLLLLLRHLHQGLNLQEAIDAPAFHVEHQPSSFWPREARPGVVVLEGRWPEATVAELRRLGHQVEVGGPWSEGRLSACSQTVQGNVRTFRAAANPRGMQGYAVGR